MKGQVVAAGGVVNQDSSDPPILRGGAFTMIR